MPETTQSLWTGIVEMPKFLPLLGDTTADVCVVGAGIAGLMTAYMLAREGRSVVVLESGGVCGGETARSTAHLSFALDDGYCELEQLFGPSGAKRAFESHSRAIDRIEEIVNREKIDCEFTRLDGFLFEPAGQSDGKLEKEWQAARRAGVEVERTDHAPFKKFRTGPCLRFPGQAQFDPLRFAAGLTVAIGRMGGRIYTGARVAKVSGGARPTAETENGPIVSAGAVVVATNTPVNDNLTTHSRQSPWRTYAMAAEIAWGAVPRALYWDTLDPYHYIRLKSASTPHNHPANDILIVGGEDHRQGESEDENRHFEWLEQWTRERFPIGEVAYRWSGLVCEPADSLAFIGRDNSEQNVYIVTGDSGHGITHGAIAGMLLTDLIHGRSNPWEELYSPSRLTARAASEYVGGTANVVASLAGWLTPGELTSKEEIAPGSGAIIRAGLVKHAVYRDRGGSFHECSAVCPHLGCIVAWNTVEKTWDCPCHGSQFDYDGKVLRGPATRNLAEVNY